MNISGDVLDRKFYPVANATQLIRLGFASRSGLENLVRKLDGGRLRFLPGASALCKSSAFHVLCDTMNSLDDPNHYGRPRMPSSLSASDLFSAVDTTEESAVDTSASVAAWQSRDDARLGTRCPIGRTDFLLAAHDRALARVYVQLFQLPTCVSPSPP